MADLIKYSGWQRLNINFEGLLSYFPKITVFPPDQLVTSCLLIFEPAKGAAPRLTGRLGLSGAKRSASGVDDQVLRLLSGGNLGLAASLEVVRARATLESSCFR